MVEMENFVTHRQHTQSKKKKKSPNMAPGDHKIYKSC